MSKVDPAALGCPPPPNRLATSLYFLVLFVIIKVMIVAQNVNHLHAIARGGDSKCVFLIEYMFVLISGSDLDSGNLFVSISVDIRNDN